MFNHSHYKKIVTILERTGVKDLSEQFPFGLIGSINLEKTSFSEIKVGNSLKPLQISISESTITFLFSTDEGFVQPIRFDDFDVFLDFLIDLVTLFSTIKDFNIKHSERLNNSQLS